MSKSSGLGQSLYVGGYDLSGDIGELGRVGGGPNLIENTGINKHAIERIGGLLDGAIDFTAFFNDAAGQAHAVLSVLPRTDVHLMYVNASSIGGAVACMVAKQANYDPTNPGDRALSIAISAMPNGYGLEWCDMLTAGLRTDTAATNGASLDGAASSTTGWSAYLQCTAFSGTDVTVKLQDSADDSSWADVTGGGFTEITAGPTVERIAGAAGATLRRYVRAATVTTGGVTSVTFAVAVTRHPSGAAA